MGKSIISEGKTTNEAIENGLKELKVSKNKVDIKVLEDENKKNFFSILTPRVVKVELTLKDNVKEEKRDVNQEERVEREYEKDTTKIENAKINVDEFLKNLLARIDEKLNYTIKIDDYTICVDINGETSGMLIGYHGDTLNAMQTILSTIANRNAENKIKLIVDIENYREKREKVLEELAEKKAAAVLKTGKSITLEPMSAYERKVIHTKLQSNTKIETYSIGEGDNRRVVISKVK